MQKQQQILQQTLKLSPQQIQVFKMLELPVIELEVRVRRELEENPTLEEGVENSDDKENDPFSQDADNDEYKEDSRSQEEISLDDYRNEDDIPDYKLQSSNRAKDERAPEFTYSDSSTFFEFLNDQIALKDLSDVQKACAEYIIGNLDNNGYLNRPLSAIADDIAFATGMDISEEILEDALMIIQDLDPAGVGARDLRECLLLQLERMKATRAHSIAYEIIDTEFEIFSKKHYDKILKNLNITKEELKMALHEIMTLNPKPGNSWSNNFEDKMEQIVPDFIIENINDDLIISLNNSNIPELKINNTYSAMCEDWANKANRNSETKNAMLFVKQKLDSARWFIDAIKQRNNTMLQTMNAIVTLQRDFFLTGDEAKLRPMILKDVAERTDLDFSTSEERRVGKECRL